MFCLFLTPVSGALSVVGVLSEDLCNVDALFTKTTLELVKTTLELVERQLRRHVDLLAARRRELPPPHPPAVEVEPTPGPSGLAARQVPAAEEESSGPSGQYVTAVASKRSSLDVEEHPSASSIFHSIFHSMTDDNDRLLESAV